jgi:ATP/maltotriose-dependent transcriptional regulator MalT
LLNKQSIKKVRKMKNKVLMGLAAIAMVAVLSSCGKKPQVEIDATNAAIAAAQTAEAAVYVPAEFAAVQDSMKAIMADVATQESKLFKKFGPAKAKLATTLTLANQVAANAATKKEEVKKEVEATMTAIKGVIEENKTLITKAPRGKEGAAVLEQIKTEMATIETSVTEAQGLFDKGSYMDALNKVKAANERATGINTELKDAIAKVKGKK